MRIKKKLLLTLLTLGVTASLATLATYSAFTAVTANAGNSIASGTVAISDNDASAAMYSVTNAKPGDATTKCIRVTYTGSLASTVKIYMDTTVTNGTLYNIKIERGSGLSGAYPACTGFTAAATLYDGALGTFQSTYNSWTSGIDARGSAWNTSDAVDYRFTITQNDDSTVDAHTSVTSSGSHEYTWEARNN